MLAMEPSIGSRRRLGEEDMTFILHGERRNEESRKRWVHCICIVHDWSPMAFPYEHSLTYFDRRYQLN